MGNAQGRARDRAADYTASSSSSSYAHGSDSNGQHSSLLGFGNINITASHSYNNALTDSLPLQLIDGGLATSPGILYSQESADYDKGTVRRLVLERRLAPFYQGLDSDTDSPSLPDPFNPAIHAMAAGPCTPPIPIGTNSASTTAPTFVSTCPSHPSLTTSSSGAPAPISASVDISQGSNARSTVWTALAAAGALSGSISTENMADVRNQGSSVQSQSLPNSTSASLMLPQSHKPVRYSSSDQVDPAHIQVFINVPPASLSLGKSFGRSLSSLVRNRTSAILTGAPSSLPISPRSLSTPVLADLSPRQMSLAQLYQNAVECPICFLIKRSQTTFEPAECPYCVVSNFGVVYSPIGSLGYMQRYNPSFCPPDASPPPDTPDSTPLSHEATQGHLPASSERRLPSTRRRKSINSDNPSVVLSDEIRSNWQQLKHKIAMERVLNQRRHVVPGNARTSVLGESEMASAATAAADLLETLTRFENASTSAERRAVRRAVRETQRDSSYTYLQTMRHMGADIEELMMMEAIRLSLNTTDAQPYENISAAAEAEQVTSVTTAPVYDTGLQADPPLVGVSRLSAIHTSEATVVEDTSHECSDAGTPSDRLNYHLDEPLGQSSALSMTTASVETGRSYSRTFDTSSLRSDRYVHVTLGPVDSGSVSAAAMESGSDEAATGMCILAVSARDEGARRDGHADDAVSFDSLAARKSFKSDMDGEGSLNASLLHSAVPSHFSDATAGGTGG
ncbi:hypothetical protein BSLG_006816 [Batrachochytrium salamandrivorans]|nr:hypothetical protein BSLG_006816 [Batrachochytrium salamandrivorans]